MLNINTIKKFANKHRLFLLVTGSILSIAAALSIVLFLLYNENLSGKIYPNISVAGVEVGGLTPDNANRKLVESIDTPEAAYIKVENEVKPLPLSNTSLIYDLEKSVQTAYLLGRDSSIKNNLLFLIKSLKSNTNLPLEFSINKEELGKNISVFSEQTLLDPIYPTIKKVGAEFMINSGKSGFSIDEQILTKKLEQKLAYNTQGDIDLELTNVDPSWSEADIETIKKRADYFYQKILKLSYEEVEIEITGDELISFLDKNNSFSLYRIDEFTQKTANEIDRPAQNPVFEFKDGKVIEFIPAEEGRKLDQPTLRSEIIATLTKMENTQENQEVKMVIETTSPDYSTEDVNDLGIRELIGRGDSKFAGSIASRVHNVGLAASRFHGILIPPGETVSFNEYLGDVSTYTGYQQAYVIKNGRTVLGDGGGVCQVSTTLFRAAMDAGLPIVERSAHSYRVSYYEQGSPPGLDATVYAPSPDLKFTNDTPGHILIQTVFSAANTTLAFEIYGTDDGREAIVTTPKVLSTIAPPEDLYVDDPTLPTGQVKQIDWKAAGARVYFDYTVKKDGETIYYKEFYSNYRPWQSVFLRGTGPV